MQDKGDQLAEALWQVGTGWKSWGECPICDAEYPANIASHVRGKNHCNKLKDKLGWREPQSFEEFEKYWQCWPLQSGRIFMFHHLTGTQKTEEGTAGTGVPAYGTANGTADGCTDGTADGGAYACCVWWTSCRPQQWCQLSAAIDRKLAKTRGQVCKAVGRGVEPAHQSMGSSMPGL
eukprot:symbB.v1.2.021073.t1/scaffold1781.1/size101559/1